MSPGPPLLSYPRRPGRQICWLTQHQQQTLAALHGEGLAVVGDGISWALVRDCCSLMGSTHQCHQVTQEDILEAASKVPGLDVRAVASACPFDPGS